MRKIYILLLISFYSCSSGIAEAIEEVNDLIEKEKYQIASERILKEMKKKRPGDRVLSDESVPRILRISADSKKIVWTEKDIIFAWDRETDDIDETDMGHKPEIFSISENGKYAVLSFPLQQNAGCMMRALSLFDDSLDYESGAHVSCNNTPAIANDGKVLYYMLDENLYQEQTVLPRKPEKIMEKSHFSAPYSKLKNKMVLQAVNNELYLFFGIGGDYNLYQINPGKQESRKTLSNVAAPFFLVKDDTSGYVIHGTTNKLKLRLVQYATAEISSPVSIMKEAEYILPTKNKNEFISGNEEGVFIWKDGNNPQQCPVLYQKFWGIGDAILYENEKGQLLQSNYEYTPEEWKLIGLLKQIRSKN